MDLPRPSGRRPARAAAFTLIELLTVITIIVILVGLIVGAAGFANTKASRSRAESEIKALSTAAENYKADNGTYPRSAKTDLINPRTQADPVSANKTVYNEASRDFYAMLSGQVMASGVPVTTPAYPPPPATTTTGIRNYWGDLKPSMLGGKDSNGSFATKGVTAINDPWGFSYGYSTIYQKDLEDRQAKTPPDTTPPDKGYNPTFDLWSIANKLPTSGSNGNANSLDTTVRPGWIINW